MADDSDVFQALERLGTSIDALKKALKDRTEADEKMVAALEAMGSVTLSAEDHALLQQALDESGEPVPDEAPGSLPLYGDPRPMSEAPRDGTHILVRCIGNPDGSGPCVVVWWRGDPGAWLSPARGGLEALYHEHAMRGWWPLPKGST